MSRKLHKHQITSVEKMGLEFTFLSFEQWDKMNKTQRTLYNHICLLRGIEPYKREIIT